MKKPTLGTLALTLSLGMFAVGCGGSSEPTQTTHNEFTVADQVCSVMKKNFAHLNTGEVEWSSFDQGNSVGGRHQIVTDLEVEGGVCNGTVKWVKTGQPSAEYAGVEVGKIIPDAEFTTRGRGPISSVEIRQDFTGQSGRVAMRYIVTGVTSSTISETAWRYSGDIPFDPTKP